MGYRGIVLSGTHQMEGVVSQAALHADDERSHSGSRARIHAGLNEDLPMEHVRGPELAASSVHSDGKDAGPLDQIGSAVGLVPGEGGSGDSTNYIVAHIDVGSASRAEPVQFDQDREAAIAHAESHSQAVGMRAASRPGMAAGPSTAAAATTLGSNAS